MKSPDLKILVVDDDILSQTILKSALEQLGYSVVVACNGREALDICQREHFPIIITDWVMPVMDGIELCSAIRAMPAENYIYILLLTTLDKKTELITGLGAGADEYLVKPIHEIELSVRLNGARRILDLETSLKQLALYDQLTGAYNRGYFDRQLAKEMVRSWRYEHPLSIIFCDIDNFKIINDSFGHQTGDQVLKEFVTRLKNSIRYESDWIVRYGGDEFVIVLPETSASGCHIIAERMRLLIADSPVSVQSKSVAVTISIGSISLENTSQIQKLTVDDIVGMADECLYRAKETGRNRVVSTQI